MNPPDTKLTELILHPERLHILVTIAGRSMTVKQIAFALPEISRASLYRHLSLMRKAKIIIAVSERRVRGQIERTYALNEEHSQIPIQEAELMKPEDWERHISIVLAETMANFRKRLYSPEAEPLKDQITFRMTPLYLTDSEYEEFAEKLRDVLKDLIHNRPGPNRRRRLMSLFIAPDITEMEETS